MRLLQINITANWGSHGRIAEGIGRVAIGHGWESHIAYGRWMRPGESRLYHIGNIWDERLHGAASRLRDCHGLCSRAATRRLTEYIDRVRPDIIHLHNIHGYYLHYPLLFSYLRERGTPVVWTLHDCWPLTGHCAHFMGAGCDRWRTGCHHCPQLSAYPRSLWLDRSRRNWLLKRDAFGSLGNVTLVPVSHWLEGVVGQSFLAGKPTRTIYNGIDTDVFRPCGGDPGALRSRYGVREGQRVILGVASNWYRKGLDDFARLRPLLPEERYAIIVVGATERERRSLPPGITALPRTDSVEQLAALYALADVYLNPTWEDSFPTTNLEALASGTPVVTYQTGGSPEAVDGQTGAVVERGDIRAAAAEVERLCGEDCGEACRARAVAHFDRRERYEEYFRLYNTLL